ncbi:MAG: hypothetical protein A3E87_07930 [Gammaproteobacteria bacterium RIFCSPHIGHO2_12_FULL_35_23]|nr:MAG: hypothetical protein A3E87_07930 [Gammaproteobacteria bacterium RIFCSPHIGHO2_12_FULL_35_23]
MIRKWIIGSFLLFLVALTSAAGFACNHGSLFSLVSPMQGVTAPSDAIGLFTTSSTSGKTVGVTVQFFTDNGCTTAGAAPTIFQGCNDVSHAGITYGFSQTNTYKVAAASGVALGAIRCVEFVDQNNIADNGAVDITCLGVNTCSPQTPGESVNLGTITNSPGDC